MYPTSMNIDCVQFLFVFTLILWESTKIIRETIHCMNENRLVKMKKKTVQLLNVLKFLFVFFCSFCILHNNLWKICDAFSFFKNSSLQTLNAILGNETFKLIWWKIKHVQKFNWLRNECGTEKNIRLCNDETITASFFLFIPYARASNLIDPMVGVFYVW